MNYLESYSEHSSIYESLKVARSILGSGNILDRILEIDPTNTKKYSGWLAKNYQKIGWNNDNEIKELISKYDSLINRNKIDRKDINSFNSISDLNNYTNEIEKRLLPTRKEDSLNYDVILDNPDVFIARPLSHKAARKLGLTRFAGDINDYTGKPDCRWCVTYKESDNWEEHFLSDVTTFYFVHLKKEEFPYNYISVSIEPIKDKGKIKYPIETEIYYHNAEDNIVDGDYPDSDEEMEIMSKMLIHMDDLMNKYGIKHLFKPSYIKERFSPDELKKYPDIKFWIDKFKNNNPELFDPSFEITYKSQDPIFNPYDDDEY